MREGLSVSVCRHWHQTLCKLLQSETLILIQVMSKVSVGQFFSCAVVRKDIAVDFYGCDAMFCLGSMLFIPKDDPKLLKKPYYNYFLYHNIS